MPADDPLRRLALAAIDADAQVRALADGPKGDRIPFADLYAYVTVPEFIAHPDFEARLKLDAAAMRDLARLLDNLGLVHVPTQAAASSGNLQRRETGEAVIQLIRSRAESDQAYLRIELTDSTLPAPRLIVVGSSAGGWHRKALPAFQDGGAQLLLKSADPFALAFGNPDMHVYLI